MTSILNKDPDWLIRLRELKDNWDEEGADVPSEESLHKTEDIIDWIIENNLDVESVDADVLGGVAIYLNGVEGRTAWISILNGRGSSVVLRHEDVIKGHIFDETNKEELKSFLIGGEYNFYKEAHSYDGS